MNSTRSNRETGTPRRFPSRKEMFRLSRNIDKAKTMRTFIKTFVCIVLPVFGVDTRLPLTRRKIDPSEHVRDKLTGRKVYDERGHVLTRFGEATARHVDVISLWSDDAATQYDGVRFKPKRKLASRHRQ